MNCNYVTLLGKFYTQLCRVFAVNENIPVKLYIGWDMHPDSKVTNALLWIPTWRRYLEPQMYELNWVHSQWFPNRCNHIIKSNCHTSCLWHFRQGITLKSIWKQDTLCRVQSSVFWLCWVMFCHSYSFFFLTIYFVFFHIRRISVHFLWLS